MKCLPSEGVPHTRVLAYEKCPQTELLTLQRIVNVSEVFSPLIFYTHMVVYMELSVHIGVLAQICYTQQVCYFRYF